MTGPVQFLPWMRVGLASDIEAKAVDGLAPGVTASSVVRLTLAATAPGGRVDRQDLVGRNIELDGPGAIAGIHEGEILRFEPVDGTADHETNYFCFVDFASPDFPWRYTPAAPVDGRLQPWLALVVVEDREGVTLGSGPAGLDQLDIDDVAAELPPAAEVWAWAHVQVDHDLGGTTVEELLAASPELFRSRLLCPRRLEPGLPWIAAIVPTFAAGRSAGLGAPHSTETGLAWGASGPITLPVYASWRFQSGPRGDFESLVRKLVPRELPSTVGQRDLDLSNPGAGLAPDPGRVITYQGALLSPTAKPRRWPAPARSQTQAALRELAGRQVPVQPTDPGDYDPRLHDPVVHPSLYGSIQSRRRSLPPVGEVPLWFDDVNTLPNDRTVAGVGTEVVRADQERLVDAAWDAVGSLAEVNRRLTSTNLAAEAGGRLEAKVKAMADERLLQFTGPLLGRLRGASGATALSQLRSSTLPSATRSSAYRRIGRPQTGAGARFGAAAPADEVVAKLLGNPTADSPIVRYRNQVAPAGADIDGLSPALDPEGKTTADLNYWQRDESILIIDDRYDGPSARARRGRRSKSRLVRPDRKASGVPRLLVRDDAKPNQFELVRNDELIIIDVHLPDAPAAHITLAPTVRNQLDIDEVLARGLRSQIDAPAADWTRPIPGRFTARPRFGRPFYERVRDLSVDYLVPGLGEVPSETVGLLETNSRFIEAVMLGANHELSREFLWREYPATLSQTWFRQFWNGAEPDIRPISRWRGRRRLGRQGNSLEANLVLLIKGTLPRRYPDLLVYAVKAVWGELDGETARVSGPDEELRWPVFAGELQSDVVFYGFDLAEDEARGSSIEGQDPGWFFVLEEKPEGVRFGLDIADFQDRGLAPAVWSDANWGHVSPLGATHPVSFVDLAGTGWLADAGPLPGNGTDPADTDLWGEDAAAMARITMQRPMRVLVHADAMLPEA